MPIRVQFRFDLRTGETELRVDDQNRRLTEDQHDDITRSVADWLAIDYAIAEIANVAAEPQPARRAPEPPRPEPEDPSRSGSR